MYAPTTQFWIQNDRSSEKHGMRCKACLLIDLSLLFDSNLILLCAVSRILIIIVSQFDQVAHGEYHINLCVYSIWFLPFYLFAIRTMADVNDLGEYHVIVFFFCMYSRNYMWKTSRCRCIKEIKRKHNSYGSVAMKQ